MKKTIVTAVALVAMVGLCGAVILWRWYSKPNLTVVDTERWR